jgi:hypothetical protein
MDYLTLIAVAVGGYALDLLLGYAILKLLLKAHAGIQSLGFFEFIHNAVTFGLGLFLGVSVIALHPGEIGLSVAVFVGWFVFSFFLVRWILGLASIKKNLTFLATDTLLDYGVGSIASVPAGLTLFSTVGAPVVTGGHTVPSLLPLSLRPIILIVGAVFALSILLFAELTKEPVEETIIAEETD